MRDTIIDGNLKPSTHPYIRTHLTSRIQGNRRAINHLPQSRQHVAGTDFYLNIQRIVSRPMLVRRSPVPGGHFQQRVVGCTRMVSAVTSRYILAPQSVLKRRNGPRLGPDASGFDRKLTPKTPTSTCIGIQWSLLNFGVVG